MRDEKSFRKMVRKIPQEDFKIPSPYVYGEYKIGSEIQWKIQDNVSETKVVKEWWRVVQWERQITYFNMRVVDHNPSLETPVTSKIEKSLSNE